MTDFFTSLEQEFHKKMNIVNKNFAVLDNPANESIDENIQQVQGNLLEADECLKQMDVESNPLPEKMRREAQQKIRKYRADYESNKAKFKRMLDKYQERKDKERLLDKKLGVDSENSYQPASLIDRQNDELMKAKRTGFAALDIAVDTNSRLKGQTDQMKKGIDRLKNMDADLADSNSLIGSMQQKIMKNKMTLYYVFGLLGLCVVLIIFSYL